MKPCEVRDGARVIRFNGDLLAEASSERASSPRWTDKALYRTDAGTYVLAQVGRTRVIHQPGCPKADRGLNRFVDEYGENIEPSEPRWTFHDCVPQEYDLDAVLVERTRYGAFILDSPEAVVDNLYKRTTGVRFLPRLSTDLLDAASKKDPKIEAVFRSELIP